MSYEHHVVNEFRGARLRCLFCSVPVPGSSLPVAANIAWHQTCLYFASPDRIGASWQLGLVTHRRCVDRLPFFFFFF